MTGRRRIVLLVLVMVVIALGVGSIAMVTLYQTHFRNARNHLTTIAKSRARLIEAVARFDSLHTDPRDPVSAREATLSQIREAHARFEGFGETGEFALAERIDDQIVFLLRHRHGSLDLPHSVNMASDLAEPMRLALGGRSGSVVGLDYRGEIVLAAYEPVGVLQLGSVAKVDLSEVRAPFVRAGLLSALGGLMLITIGAVLLFRIGNPLAVHVEESERRYRNLFESATDLLIWRDLEGNVLDANPAACKAYGYSNREMRELNIRVLLCEQAHAGFAKPEGQSPDGSAFTYESVHRRKDGSTFPVDVRRSPVPHRGEQAFLGAMRDISARKQAEDERRRLEKKIQETQRRESLAVLAGGIAHDFNNLMLAVLGNASLAKDELPRGSSGARSLVQIENAAEQAAELCKQMLAYSGKGHLPLRAVDLSEVVREMLHMLRVSISKHVSLKLNLPERLPAIEGDATQLRQIVMNLILNASEAMQDTDGFIELSTGVVNGSHEQFGELQLAQESKSDRCGFVKVVDTGAGFDSRVRAKIFDPFFTTKFTGRGLGLAAVLGIVRRHGGAVYVDSRPGRGTAFSILLPASAQTAVHPPVREVQTVSGWRGSGLVLVVDDEQSIRSLTRRILESSGFRVLTATDGLDALRVFGEHAGDVQAVLLDMTMPHMNGAEALQELRKLRPAVPVILTSGYGNQEFQACCSDPYVVGFLEKPYRPAQLLEIMRQSIGDRIA